MVDSHYIKTILNALLAKIKSIRFDWNVNDPSQEGYIKNRTHWSKVEEKLLLPETEYEFLDNSTMASAGITWYYADFTLPFSTADYTVGDTIKVLWDSTEYDVTLNETWQEGFFGNLAIFYYIQTGGSTNYPEGVIDTGEPFFIYQGMCATLSTDTSHNICLVGIKEKIHKLDEKYLPDDIVRTDELATVATSGSYYDLNDTPIIYTDVVRYSNSQSLTTAQKDRARTNIGAANVDHTHDYAELNHVHDFSDLTINDIESVRNTLEIENGMVFVNDKAELPTTKGSRHVVYGNGKFVAISYAQGSSDISYSDDGINWNAATSPRKFSYPYSWCSLIFGNGKFVIASNDGRVATSTDGIDWTLYNVTGAGISYSAVYGNGKFILAGSNATFMYYSSDGITWNYSNTLPAKYVWSSATYGNKYILLASYAVDASNNTTPTDVVIYSDDGINWNSSTMPVVANWQSVVYGDNKYVAVASGTVNNSSATNIAAYSDDGINWNPVTMPVAAKWKYITYGNGMFVATTIDSADNVVAYSRDGINWFATNINTDGNHNWMCVGYGLDKFIALTQSSNIVAFSYDGIKWNTGLKTIIQNNVDIVSDVLEILNHTHDQYLTEIPESYAQKSYVDDTVAALVNSAPEKLNTLDELAAALGDDENFANTVTTELSNKAPINSPAFTGSISMGRKADTGFGYNSVATGSNTTASAPLSHAEGNATTASGNFSHAEGNGTTASNVGAHAEGTGTTASGTFSHAEGSATTASGQFSHAEGANSVSSGHFSHAEGSSTIAFGSNSHAEGEFTTANSKAQHAQGRYNILDVENAMDYGNYAHIVGNGTAEDARSNAYTLDWSGNAWFSGDVYVGSTSGTNKDEGSKKLVTVDEMNAAIAAAIEAALANLQ